MDELAVNPDALLCALVLAPHVYARNRFFDLHQRAEVARVRRRAKRLRGILRELAGHDREPAQIVGEQVLGDGRVLLRYELPGIGLRRSTSLTAMEAATLRFALAKAGVGAASAEDRRLVLEALRPLGRDLLGKVTTTSDEGE